MESVLLCAGHRCVSDHAHGLTVFAGSDHFLIVLAPVRACLAGAGHGSGEDYLFYLYLLHLFTQGKPKQLTLVFIAPPRSSLCSYALDVS